MGEPQDRWDRLLEDAFVSYGEVPVRDGLEGRIIARVTGARQRQSRVTRAFAGAIAAMVLTLCWLWPAMRKTERLPMQTDRRSTFQPRVRAAAPIRAARNIRVSGRRMVPKRSRFPSAMPLTGEEQALLRLVNDKRAAIPPELTHPEATMKPLEIAVITIRPLNAKSSAEEDPCCGQ